MPEDPKPQDKHGTIGSTIGELERSVGGFENLLRRICNEPSPDVNGKDREEPSLAQFLSDDAMSRIGACNTRLREIHTKMEEVLF